MTGKGEAFMLDAKRIHPRDNVAVALRELRRGERALDVTLSCDVPAGHKFALLPIALGEDVVKYGCPIGRATKAIGPGEWVHSHNLATKLSGQQAYAYAPEEPRPAPPLRAAFQGYLRPDGRAGIRNEVWVVPTVGCVNRIAQALAAKAHARRPEGVDGVYAFPHPYGCSQLGQDQATTQALLAGLCRHPNAGGVLVLGLGCENNNVQAFQEATGLRPSERLRFLSAQEVADEEQAGLEALEALMALAAGDRRQSLDLRYLCLGMKCGGSDGYSGISANPLLGALADGLCASGGSCLLTEVPEMFGAEELLMARCASREIFEQTVELINGFKAYFGRYGQPVYENPSPGNRAGGITTLEEKSLGCVQKGGSAPVRGVLSLGQAVGGPGLQLLCAPGNDLVSSTALCASGAQLLLFTTGRGTPFGAPAPVLKLASNSRLARAKPHWVDYDAGPLLQGREMEQALAELLALVLETASGRQTCSERMGCREIALFKDGVTL